MFFVIIMVFIGCEVQKPGMKISPVRKPASEGKPGNIGAFEGHVPSDAVVLFDGTDLSEWTYTDGKSAGWIISDGDGTRVRTVFFITENIPRNWANEK